MSVSAGIEIAYELGIYVPMNLPLGRLKMWASVPEIIVNVPSESCRWDAYPRPSLRSLVNWALLSSDVSAAGAPAMRV